jgi:lipopolysaccharide export system protein LptA
MSNMIVVCLLTLCLIIIQHKSNTAFSQSNFETKFDPIHIEANEGIEWLSDKNVYIARGEATAKQNNFQLKSDVIKAHYREKQTGDTEIYRLEAIRKVVVLNSNRIAYGDYGVYDLDNSVTVLTGKNLRLKTALETIRARKSLEYWDEKRLAIAKGNATAQRGEKQVKADTLKVYFSKTKDESLTANRIEAVGNVKISTPNEVAVGDEAVYYIEKELVTLLGHVKITRGKSQLNGSIAEVNLKTGRSRLLSKSGLDGNQKVRGLFTRDVKQPEKK